PSVLRFRLYQILAGPIFAGAFRPFGFFAVPTLPDPISFPLLGSCGPNLFPVAFGVALPFG
ncbi:hypothetical protein ACFP4F_03150, partial [Streptomyces ochraceiscleroticus]